MGHVDCVTFLKCLRYGMLLVYGLFLLPAKDSHSPFFCVGSYQEDTRKDGKRGNDVSPAGTVCRDPKFHPLRSIIEGYANNSFVVRQEEREYILPLGSEITAIGQVTLLHRRLPPTLCLSLSGAHGQTCSILHPASRLGLLPANLSRPLIEDWLPCCVSRKEVIEVFLKAS